MAERVYAHVASAASLVRFPWARWPQRRCRAKHKPRDGAVYFGRCELVLGHVGPHALDRGMDIIEWATDAECARHIERRYELSREIVERRTGMPAYLASDENWVAALEEAYAADLPEPEPMTGLRLAVRLANGGSLNGDSRADIEAFHAALRQRRAAPLPSKETRG